VKASYCIIFLVLWKEKTFGIFNYSGLVDSETWFGVHAFYGASNIGF